MSSRSRFLGVSLPGPFWVGFGRTRADSERGLTGSVLYLFWIGILTSFLIVGWATWVILVLALTLIIKIVVVVIDWLTDRPVSYGRHAQHHPTTKENQE